MTKPAESMQMAKTNEKTKRLSEKQDLYEAMIFRMIV